MRARRTLRRPPARTALTAAGVLAAVVLTGCGQGDTKPGPEMAGGDAGVDETVDDDITVLDVELAYPLDHVYEPGEDAPLYLAISNTGEQPDTLVEVTGPDFASAVDGTPADGLSIDVPANDSVYVGAEDEPTLTLVDVARELRSSESVEVTFRFDSAGEVTVQAVVAAEGQRRDPGVDFPDPDEDPSDDD